MSECWHDDGPGPSCPTDCCCPCWGCHLWNTYTPPPRRTAKSPGRTNHDPETKENDR